MFDLAASKPDFWQNPEVREPNSALRMDGDFLSEDFCVIDGQHFFVRCVLDIPVHGLDQWFGYGVWSTLSRANFDKYVEGFDDGNYEDFGPWTGWFSNNLRVFGETLNLPCWVEPQQERQRPLIDFGDLDHPIALAQREGISAERVLEIYAAYGHAPG